MKTKQTPKSSRITDDDDRQLIDNSRRPVSSQTKMSTAKQTTGTPSAKKGVPKTLPGPERNVSITKNSPYIYKSVHNIGKRKATEHVISYKETEIAVCCKDSYWPNAKLDLSGPSRAESTLSRAVLDRNSNSFTHEHKEEEKVDVKQKPMTMETSVVSRNDAKVELNSSGSSVDNCSLQPVSNKRQSFECQKATKRKSGDAKTDRTLNRTLNDSGKGAKKVLKDEVDALLSAAVSTEDSEDEDDESPVKGKVRLSSKKRAELSFLARGVSASGCSEMFPRRSKNGEQQQTVRARRTASLNAGAIVSLMLQKEESVAKKDRHRWDDDNSDSDMDDSMSSSSESADSNFSEYSAPGESKQQKKSRKTASGASTEPSTSCKATVTASVPRVVLQKELELTSSFRHKDKPSDTVKLISAAESSASAVVQDKSSTNKEVTVSSREQTGSGLEKSVTPGQNTSVHSKDITEKGSNLLELEIDPVNKASKKLPGKNVLPDMQATGSESLETQGKRKRKDYDDSLPAMICGKRMASLNAQAILAASRDERIKRSRLSEGTGRSSESQSKRRSFSGERTSDDSGHIQNKSGEKSSPCPGDCDKAITHNASATSDSLSITKSTGMVSSESLVIDPSGFPVSTSPSKSGDRVQFAGTYVELVAPPTSVQLVEMTSAPVLTPNKTYQQLDRPQNCQQYSSDRHPAPSWSGNSYGVAQFHELHSSNGHQGDFPKGSGDRLEKPQSNIVTALIPHATSLAPAVPIRFTAHIVQQNPLPQHGFYGQLQPHPPYFPSERYPYAGPNLFSYPAKAFGTSTSFAAPHIPTDLYNASRQLQVYEVQAARPVYGRQSDFNLQLCQPQFITPLTGQADSRDQLQHLYRPYLSPPAHQPFQHPQHSAMCGPYMQPPVQVALAVPSVNPMASEKSHCAPAEGHSAMADQKLMKTSPSESQPKLTDISYSLVKRSSQSSRRKQVETKHSSTQVKSHEVAALSGVCTPDKSGYSSREKLSPDQLKPEFGKLHVSRVAAEKIEGTAMTSEVSRGSTNAHLGKMAPPAHRQSYTSGIKSGDNLEEMHYSDLRNCNVSAHKSCLGVRSGTSHKEHLNKTEDSKFSVSTDVADMKPNTKTIESNLVVPYSKTEAGECLALKTDSFSAKGLPKKLMPSEALNGSTHAHSVADRIDLHPYDSSVMQSSIVDLSQEKELDLSKKSRPTEVVEDSKGATPLKKKLLKHQKTTTDDSVKIQKVESADEQLSAVSKDETASSRLDFLSPKSDSLCGSIVYSTETVGMSQLDTGLAKSCLSQLENFVASQPEQKCDHGSLQNDNPDKQLDEDKSIPKDSDLRLGKSDVKLPESVVEVQIDVDLTSKTNKTGDAAKSTDTKPDKEFEEQILDSSKSDFGKSEKQQLVEVKADFPVVQEPPPEKSASDMGSSQPPTHIQECAEEVKSPSRVIEQFSDTVIDLTKPSKPYEEPKPDEDKPDKDKAKDVLDNDQSGQAHELTESKLSDKNSMEENCELVSVNVAKKYRVQGSTFRASAPVKRLEHPTRLARKRIKSAVFGNKNSSAKNKHQSGDRCISKTLHGAGSRVTKRAEYSMSNYGAKKNKKELLTEGRDKKLLTAGTVCKRKNSSEREKVQKLMNEEMSKRKTDGIKCWKWKEPGFMKLTHTEVDGPPVQQLCFPAIQHTNGDVIRVRDSVFVRSGMRKKDIPYIAKIYAFWENKETGEMMMGVFWYYRQHQGEGEYVSKYLNNEVFASRHRDVIPVACIEDRCYVLTFNEFCRYKAEQKRLEYNFPQRQQVIPAASEPYSRAVFRPPTDADPDTVFLCRSIYDIKLRRIMKNPRKLHT